MGAQGVCQLNYGANPVGGIPTPKLRALCSPHRPAKARTGLGPTHEEVISTIARDDSLYRQLPLHLTKFKPSSGMKFDPLWPDRA